MAKYFTLQELTYSDTAVQKHIDNRPSKEIESHLIELMDTLDSLRAFYGKPIKVTSGYRSKPLNKAVGGSDTSVHMIGYAADLKPCKDTMDTFIRVVKEWGETHDFDQLLVEKNSKGNRWIHLGLYNNSHEQRHQVKNLYVK